MKLTDKQIDWIQRQQKILAKQIDENTNHLGITTEILIKKTILNTLCLLHNAEHGGETEYRYKNG